MNNKVSIYKRGIFVLFISLHLLGLFGCQRGKPIKDKTLVVHKEIPKNAKLAHPQPGRVTIENATASYVGMASGTYRIIVKAVPDGRVNHDTLKVYLTIWQATTVEGRADAGAWLSHHEMDPMGNWLFKADIDARCTQKVDFYVEAEFEDRGTGARLPDDTVVWMGGPPEERKVRFPSAENEYLHVRINRGTTTRLDEINATIWADYVDAYKIGAILYANVVDTLDCRFPISNENDIVWQISRGTGGEEVNDWRFTDYHPPKGVRFALGRAVEIVGPRNTVYFKLQYQNVSKVYTIELYEDPATGNEEIRLRNAVNDDFEDWP